MSEKGVIIAGIVVAVVVFLLFVGSIVAYCLQKRRARMHKQVDEEHTLQRVIVPQTEDHVQAATRRMTMEDKCERREFGH